MASRAVSNTTVSFGLVKVPVAMHTAVSSEKASFRTLHDCGTPINMKRWCSVCERDVAGEEVTKGYEYAKGQFVKVTEDELRAASPASAEEIEIACFVDEFSVPRVYQDRTYYLAPGKGNPEAFVLLRDAMRRTSSVAIGKFILWGNENLCSIRAEGDALVLCTLHWAEDVRPAILGPQLDVSDAKANMADQLVASLREEEFEPDVFVNEHRERVRELLSAKLMGEEYVVPEAPAPESIPDITEALKRSIAAAKKVKSKKPARAKAA